MIPPASWRRPSGYTSLDPTMPMVGSDSISSTREESHPSVTWVSLFKKRMYFPLAAWAAWLQFNRKPWFVLLRRITRPEAYLSSWAVASVDTSSAIITS